MPGTILVGSQWGDEGKGKAGLRHQAAEPRVGEDVGPGGRRQSRHGVDGDHVLAGVRGEPAQAIPEQEALGRRGMGGGLRGFGTGDDDQGFRVKSGFMWLPSN